MVSDDSTQRRLGIPSSAALVVSTMVGTGIYSTSGLLIRDLGSPGLVLLAWVIGGLVATAGALTYGRLATALPFNGGEYVILTRLYHPALGFIAGWVSVIAGFVAPLAAAAVAFASYAERYAGGLPKVVLALGVIWLVTALHLRGVGFGSKMQVLVTALQLLLVGAFVWVGVAWGQPERLLSAPLRADVGLLSPEFAHALVYVSYSYSGYNAAIYVAGEIREPERSLPVALVSASLVVTLLYLLINVVYIASGPLASLSGAVDIGAVAIAQLLGPVAGVVTAVLVSVGLVAFISAMTLAGPRVLAAMSQDYPRLSFLTPERNASPLRVTLFQSVFASLLVITAGFDALLTYVGLMLSLSTLLGILGVFRLERFVPRSAPSRSVRVAAVIASLLLVWVVVSTTMVSPWSALTAGLTVLLAWGGFRWCKGREA